MDFDKFVNTYAAAHSEHAAEHNAAAATPMGLAAGLSSIPATIGDAKKAFCTDFPKAYAAFVKYQSWLRMIPYVGQYVPVISAALTAVSTEVVPIVCGTGA